MGEGVHTVKQAPKTDRSYLRDTDKGLNKQEAFRVNQLESKIRNRKTEKGYLVGANGEILGQSIKSSASEAAFYVSDLRKSKDGILTHNHPTEGANSGLHDTIAGRIGVPLSPQDIRNAVKYDQKEVRAVTPTYTYSIRRPKGGWKDTEGLMRELNDFENNYSRAIRSYGTRQTAVDARNGKTSYQRAKEVSDRANVGIQYSAVKKLAKKYGFEFTRKKVN